MSRKSMTKFSSENSASCGRHIQVFDDIHQALDVPNPFDVSQCESVSLLHHANISAVDQPPDDSHQTSVNGTNSVGSSGHISVDVQGQDAAIAYNRINGGHELFVTQGAHAPIDPILIHEVTELHRRREDFMRAKNRLLLQVKSLCRRYCHGDKKEAEILYRAIRGKKKSSHADASSLREIYGILIDQLVALECCLKNVENDLIGKTQQLYGCEWFCAQRGLSVISYAQIIGEAGDIRRFATVSKLWKWMMVSVINGERQRKCKDKKLALLHRYSPQRRAYTSIIACNMMMKNHPYKSTIYKREYAKFLERGKTKKHAMNHGLRVMVKRLLADIWEVWHGKRSAKNCLMPISEVPIHSQSAQRNVIASDLAANNAKHKYAVGNILGADLPANQTGRDTHSPLVERKVGI